MTEGLITGAFIVGLIVGVATTVYGFKLGFRASYEIRKGQEGPEDKGLFAPNKNPAEFDIIEEKETEE